MTDCSDSASSITQTCFHGTCVDGQCKCFQYYSGSDCSTFYQDEYGVAYLVYFYFNCVLWVVIAFYVGYKLVHLVRNDKQWNAKHITVGLLFIGTFLRIISFLFTIDLNWQRIIDLQPFGELTFYFLYPCFVSAYLCQLFTWAELLKVNTAFVAVHKLPRLRKLFLIINLIVFPVEIITRVIVSEYYDTLVATLMFLTWVLYFGVVIFASGIGSLVIGALVLRKISETIVVKDDTTKKVKKMTISVVVITALLLFASLIIALNAYFPSNEGSAVYPLSWISRLLEASLTCLIVWTVRPPNASSSTQSSKSTLTLPLRNTIELQSPSPSQNGPDHAPKKETI